MFLVGAIAQEARAEPSRSAGSGSATTADYLRTASGAAARPTAVGRANSAEDDDTENHFEMAAFEAGVALGIPTYAYWSTEEHQAVDFALKNDWASWRTKLFTTERLRFDTNPFHVNAIRHPLAGFLDYQIVRTNGYGPLAATVFAYAKGAFWEYFIEYLEDPSINDLIFNGAGGLALGEPFYQLGQLWRGSRVTLLDRARTAVFSPFDALHDTYRAPHRWWRPRVWHELDFEGGALLQHTDGLDRSALVLGADLDLVSDTAFANGGAQDHDTKVGAWSRIHSYIKFGQASGDRGVVGTLLQTQTSVDGHYRESADGNGIYYGIGAAFTYRQDWLAIDTDRLAIAHLLGPQLQLSRRTPRYEVRWDLAAYADFGLIQALVFSPNNPFPRPPPYYSSLQTDGYIDAVGGSVTTRLRLRTGAWRLDLEAWGHALRQVVNHDRDPDVLEGSTLTAAPATTTEPVTTYGVDEQRAFWKAQLSFQPGRPGTLGAALIVEGAERRSSWKDDVRIVTDLSLGAVLQLSY